ncbi:hypothetical protein [Rhodobium gokarnense]|uniref:Transcriptional regulator n=1 Tax=Rhodobium gokarnense TaxID=364296 RepID=A0ABT3HF43_9HYPH|nr:hypothetical protein [Rhodobium gokarnense]MCW2308944.1 hypothetical protein [Rhodobium gokarnense]
MRDHSATETARQTGLSLNSVHAIFRKIRVYFYEAGLFTDFYGGQDPLAYESDNPLLEFQLLEFYLKRHRTKMGLRSPTTEPPYHFAESCWRYDFHVMMKERRSEQVYDMMLAHLVEIIRICGPVGRKPENRALGLRAVMRQMDGRILWLERNAPGFRQDHRRAALREIRAISSDGE